MTPEIVYEEGPPRRYLLNGVEVPSVTTILGVLQKGSLPWWGMTVGIEGCQWLSRNLQPDLLLWEHNTVEDVTKLLTEHKLTVNHVRDKAATRGKGVHQALEDWCVTRKVPSPSTFPEEERGYVQALAKALIALKPIPVDIEVMVGSEEHQYAGRFDFLGLVDGKSTLLDLKTSKRVYTEAHLQLAGYEAARVEMGHNPTDQQLILRLDRSGEYEVEVGYAEPGHFLGVKAAYDALESLKAAKPSKRRKAAA